MTTPMAGRSRSSHSDPTRIGQARPSHLISTNGVGAIADLPAMSVIVRGLDAWSADRQDAIDEPRLLAQVKRTLGQQVQQLRTAPWAPDADNDPWTRIGVPVTPFPRWLRCPACFRLGVADGSEFVLIHRWGRRPDLAKFVHRFCAKQGQRRESSRRACISARFVVACESGHLDEFPYVEFVHRGAPEVCSGPQLSLQDAASTLSPRVTISCSGGCSVRPRSITDAAGPDGYENLPRCRGRHPHLQRFDTCGQPPRLMVLGASNLWFSVTASALHLPSDPDLVQIVERNWSILGRLPDQEVAKLVIDSSDALRELRDVDMDTVWRAIKAVTAAGDPADADDDVDLLDAEWELLSRPTTKRQDKDFKAAPTATPTGWSGLLEQVVLVSRLREVRALIGFTRLSAPERHALEPANRVRLSAKPETWVPAVEQRGEGIFLELHEDAVARWTASVDDHPRIVALRHAYARWAANRDKDVQLGFPIPRYLLLHTLSHLLIRQVALECGYSSASIRERLYVGRPDRPAAGLLLCTAASDSEGTLGGLVALGKAHHLKRLLDNAFEDVFRCSSDPLCAEHEPEDPSDMLHGAACHACLFSSETSCESNNRWLDRSVLVDLTGDGLVFPR